jgi:DNA-directed RNA polymerase specialized sigma subunit
MTEAMDVAARQAVARLWRWRVPSNWCRPQWREEIASEVALTVLELARGTALEPQTDARRIQSRIQNKILSRYRQEWAFSKHFDREVVTEPRNCGHRELEHEYLALLALQEAVVALSESDQRLIQQIYWGKCTETQIAAEAGVSVPAICKRKNRILRHLRGVLGNFED